MPLPLSIVVYRRHFCLHSCTAGLLRHRDSISNCCTKRRWPVQAIAGIFPPLMTRPWFGARTCRPCVLEREAVSRKRVRRRYLLSPLPIRDFVTAHLICLYPSRQFYLCLRFFLFLFFIRMMIPKPFSSNASIVYSIFRYGIAFPRVKRL